jgi:hypothetical protein
MSEKVAKITLKDLKEKNIAIKELKDKIYRD